MMLIPSTKAGRIKSHCSVLAFAWDPSDRLIVATQIACSSVPLDIATICGYIYTVVGRPPKPPNERRDKPLRIRLSPGERTLLDQAAAQAGQDTSAWAREILLTVAGQEPPKDRPDIQSSENR